MSKNLAIFISLFFVSMQVSAKESKVAVRTPSSNQFSGQTELLAGMAAQKACVVTVKLKTEVVGGNPVQQYYFDSVCDGKQTSAGKFKSAVNNVSFGSTLVSSALIEAGHTPGSCTLSEKSLSESEWKCWFYYFAP